jgi:O-acetyl-ADP-ribose deacetylase (regulator of RNase III)
MAIAQQKENRVKLLVGDITTLAVDAVVNAANEALLGGSGVDGAIHRAAGPGLFEECRSIGYCPEGEARITMGYLLPAKFVIHTVGPVWEGGGFGEADLLAACYRESLALAASRAVQTIAFPCIATGAHGFPPDKACGIAIDATFAWLFEHELPREVTFCCFSEADAAHYRNRLGREALA